MNNAFMNETDPDKPWEGAPPGSPPRQRFEGPWFTTQLVLASSLGLIAFLVFSYCRTRYPVVFAPRTKLKGFSPHEAHAHQAFFGWIMPTIRTSEYTILQIVGLDAAVLLSFFKMSFKFFSVCSLLAVVVLIPVNYRNNVGAIEDPEDDESGWFISMLASPSVPSTTPSQDWLDLITEASSYLTVHFIFTYVFTLLALKFIHSNYKRFIRSRQLFSLELVHSIAARTVMVSSLPPHLRNEHSLAVYFENMNLAVESVNLVREPGTLEDLLHKRTKALLNLENAWVDYVGNPSTVENYDPSLNVRADVDGLEGQRNRLVVPKRKRPTFRPSWSSFRTVDAIEHFQQEFQDLDDQVLRRRQMKFHAATSAFVTFEKMSSAQIATQAVLASHPSETLTCLAPEPRDIIWANMALSSTTLRIREFVVMGLMGLLLFFWVFPVTALAGLLSYKEIKKVAPWLGRLIDSSPQIKAIVQNSLPSIALISLMALLPFILEFFTYQQGYRARSWIEYSLLKKYFLFLLVNVVFIFLLASTYLELVLELANSPAKVPERLAASLQKGNARHFFLCYVILQGFGIMPMQLLNLGVLIPSMFKRLFVTRTPRDFAELNAPPMINYGTVYPQAILVFVVTLLYSIIQPLIVFFGASYFGIAYVVYKYKLLFVFYKPYESQGQAWPITCSRLFWGMIIFQTFMTGIFTLNRSYVLSSLMTPLILFTLYCAWSMHQTFKPLSGYVSLSSTFEAQRGEDTDDVIRLRAGHPVTLSQSNLSRRRYAQNDETLYVAPEDDRTDYSQPPMEGWYPGVLNTGKRRYGHPALTGVLPQPWLPIKKGQSLANRVDREGGSRDQAVVLTLRKRYSIVRRDVRDFISNDLGMAPSTPLKPRIAGPSTSSFAHGPSEDHMTPSPRQNRTEFEPEADGLQSYVDDRPTPRHGRSTPALPSHRLSFDHATGIIMLPEDGKWLLQDDSDSEEAGSTGQEVVIHTGDDLDADNASLPATSTPGRHKTYYHHPERRRQTLPGAFPQSNDGK